MEIQGLSNQWKTWERLFESYAVGDNADEFIRGKYGGMQRLLLHLRSIDGPPLWAGTSHSQLNFVARDVTSQFERIPSLVTIDASWCDNELQCSFKIGYPLPPEFRAWDDAWTHGYANDLESATSMIFAAIAASGSNPDRLGANWHWYVCPKCDFHSPVYESQCQRCSAELPTERKMQLTGLYRRAGG